jgi:hypothetical protein
MFVAIGLRCVRVCNIVVCLDFVSSYIRTLFRFLFLTYVFVIVFSLPPRYL